MAKCIVPHAFREINAFAQTAKNWLETLRVETDPMRYASALLNIEKSIDSLLERCDLALRGDFSEYYEQEYVDGIRVQ